MMHEQIIVLRKLPFGNEKDRKSRLIINDLMKKEVANSVWHIAPVPPSYRRFHPAAFPEEIPYRLIQLYSNVGDLVLDPFVGSGQTTKMARYLKRKYNSSIKRARSRQLMMNLFWRHKREHEALLRRHLRDEMVELNRIKKKFK